jgi:hypothetical protein
LVTASSVEAVRETTAMCAKPDFRFGGGHARATASKATVYRHWPTKAALVMDAFMARVDPAAPFPDTGSALENFVRQLRSTAALFEKGMSPFLVASLCPGWPVCW